METEIKGNQTPGLTDYIVCIEMLKEESMKNAENDNNINPDPI